MELQPRDEPGTSDGDAGTSPEVTVPGDSNTKVAISSWRAFGLSTTAVALSFGLVLLYKQRPWKYVSVYFESLSERLEIIKEKQLEGRAIVLGSGTSPSQLELQKNFRTRWVSFLLARYDKREFI